MIILDTNVISELMKTEPDALVIQWINQKEPMELYISTITIAEISYGLHALSEGTRRTKLENAFHKAILEAFEDRILDFDTSSAHIYGKIMAERKRLGKPLGVPDGQIASIACFHGASLATRNVKDFQNCGINIINPFKD